MKRALDVYERAVKDLPSSSVSEKRKIRDRIARIYTALSALGSVRPIQSRFEAQNTSDQERRDDR